MPPSTATASRRVFAAVALLLAGATALSSAAPLPYQADYAATYNGMAVTARRQLEPDPQGYRESLTLDSLLGNVTEQSLFSIDHDGAPRPHSSSYELSLFGVKRSEQQQFNWPQLTVDYRRGDKQRSVVIDSDCLDITTHRWALVADLRAGRAPLSYCVISRGKRKQYLYQVVGEEQLETPLGSLRTLHVARSRDLEDPRGTELWLALDWQLLLVKLRQQEEDEEYLLDLAAATVANQAVAGLPARFTAPITDDDAATTHRDLTGNL
jgi:hypothetical protein